MIPKEYRPYVLAVLIITPVLGGVFLACASKTPLNGPETPLESTISPEAFWHTWMPIHEGEIDYLADAIFWAEGGHKTKYPFGIKSINCGGNYDYCRRICKNTIRNQVRRYRQSPESKEISYLQSLKNRYAPGNAENDPTGLNENWLQNVIWFLENPKQINGNN